MGCKKTYTYATDPKIKEKAERKAKREKTTLSEKIDEMLRQYVAPVQKLPKGTIPLPADYVNFDKIGILSADGSITDLKQFTKR